MTDRSGEPLLARLDREGVYTRCCKEAAEEIRRLQAWKESALAHLNAMGLHAIGRELNIPLGQDVGPQILPGIRALKAASCRAHLAEPEGNPKPMKGGVLDELAWVREHLDQQDAFIDSEEFQALPDSHGDFLLAQRVALNSYLGALEALALQAGCLEESK